MPRSVRADSKRGAGTRIAAPTAAPTTAIVVVIVVVLVLMLMLLVVVLVLVVVALLAVALLMVALLGAPPQPIDRTLGRTLLRPRRRQDPEQRQTGHQPPP